MTPHSASADEPSVSPSDPEIDQDDEPQGLLDVHRKFLLGIDDKSRLGYTILGLATLIIPPMVVLIVRPPLISLTALGTLLGSAVFVILVGRRLALGRQDRVLRQRVERYCSDNGVELHDLLKEAIESERYEFFVKLFLLPGKRPVDS